MGIFLWHFCVNTNIAIAKLVKMSRTNISHTSCLKQQTKINKLPFNWLKFMYLIIQFIWSEKGNMQLSFYGGFVLEKTNTNGLQTTVLSKFTSIHIETARALRITKMSCSWQKFSFALHKYTKMVKICLAPFQHFFLQRKTTVISWLIFCTRGRKKKQNRIFPKRKKVALQKQYQLY